jgi:hypothetical protein
MSLELSELACNANAGSVQLPDQKMSEVYE